VIAYTIEDTIDVDAKKDLEYLEFYMENRETELLRYLRENFKPLDETGLV
jgi:N-acylneuraminate cytidylyltransferase